MLIINGDYPIDESKDIVRYISFTKFVDLILSEKIFFANAKMLSDQFEFKLTNDHKEEVLKKYLEIYDQEGAEAVANMFERTAEIHKHQFYINSWSEESDESYAMWKIYLGGQDGVSIKTDFNSMKEAFAESDPNIQIGKVFYGNQLGEHSAYPKMAYRKMKFYEYEKEIRLSYFSSKYSNKVVGDQGLGNRSISEKEFEDLNLTGFKIKVDLDFLIKEIRISPFSHTSFELLVTDFLTKVKPSIVSRIVKSRIMDR